MEFEEFVRRRQAGLPIGEEDDDDVRASSPKSSGRIDCSLAGAEMNVTLPEVFWESSALSNAKARSGVGRSGDSSKVFTVGGWTWRWRR